MKYQKQHYLNDGIYERDEDKFHETWRKIIEETVLEAYGGQSVENFKTIHGEKMTVLSLLVYKF